MNRLLTWLLVPAALMLSGCFNLFSGSMPDSSGGTSGDTTAAGDVSGSALSFKGLASGTVSPVSSTGGAAGEEAARKFAARAQARSGTAWLEDVEGNRLLDASGQPYPEFEVTLGGTFELDELPVGVDFVLAIDIDGDGTADLRTVLNVPAGEDTLAGSLEGASCDPLSTLCEARFRDLLARLGIGAGRVRMSAAGLIARVRAAYEHLYGDSGVDEAITIDELLGLSDERLAELFELLVPAAARRGMDMFNANLRLEVAADVEAVVKAVAEILVRGGFAVADDPQGIDLSFLAELKDVVVSSLAELDRMRNEEQFGLEEDRQAAFPGPGPTIYYSTSGEVDRNYVHQEDRPEGPRGPIFSEHVLTRMAELYLDGKTISLGELYELIVDVDAGLGARLMYFRFGGPATPPVNVFQSPDGGGVERDMGELLSRINEMRFSATNPDEFAAHQAELRAILKEFLAGTAPPSFEALFQGILMPRVPSADVLARLLRSIRAHLPFSQSGPSQFFVLATADSFEDAGAVPVTVDLTMDADGRVTRAAYHSAGAGSAWVQFGPPTQDGMMVHFISVRNGRPLHDKKGRPQNAELADDTIFASVGGKRFIDAFSRTGTNYPGTALQIPNPHFNPDLPADPLTNPPSLQAFVLTDKAGPDAKPIRVNYGGGIATLDSQGMYYLLFTERTPQDGLFALISATGEQALADADNPESRVLIRPQDVVGLVFELREFRHVFGVDVPNRGYDPNGAPYYDDIDSDGVQDSGEPTFDFRPFLMNPNDWRSTRIDAYYRRADNNGTPAMTDVDFGSQTPRLKNGVPLVPRTLKPARNAYRFGRPALTMDLLSVFAPPEFFNGTQAINRDTRVNPFMALALMNLVFESIHNLEALIDFDGPGPLPVRLELINANVFVLPIGDPLQLIVERFRQIARAPASAAPASP